MSEIPSRTEVEDFLFEEADLLDQWRLPEWLNLFTDDAVYQVPCTDLPADASPDENLFYIADDRFRLGERVKRLMKRTAHAEFPHSKTRRMVGNVRIRGRKDDLIEVGSVFTTYRTKDGVTDVFFGSAIHQLVEADGGFKIRSKRCLLDSDGLRPQGRISIVL
ncbi:MAG TPA: aromatic-ring-hydroxylating dioxygenase subunit beta [Chthoniobacterales bacterium]